MRVRYLNHASMLIELADVRLLTDPWLSGTAFAGGWGLAYDNPDALDLAVTATHLWISHWHSDHLHAPSLEAIASRAPEMTVLANVSHNFSMVERLRACGFRDVRPIEERVPVALSPRVRATRYPTAGIDNMLHVVGDGVSLLDYNDCNLPVAAARAIREKIGPIDVLLTNYNHAGKLFDREPDGVVKETFFSAMVRAVDALAPRHVIPFASSHYYRTLASRAQNGSLVDFDEVASRTAHDPRFAVMRVGDALEVDGDRRTLTPRMPRLPRAPFVAHEDGEQVPERELVAIMHARCTSLARLFPLIGRLCPPLDVRVADLGVVLRLRLGRAPERLAASVVADIVATSRALADWHGRRFGDDTFFAGAHFDVEREDARAIRVWALITLLEASHLDPRRAAAALLRREGRAFFWNRREEIRATLAAGSVRAGELRG